MGSSSRVLLLMTLASLGLTPATVSAGAAEPVFVVATTATEESPWRPVAEASSAAHGDAEIIIFAPDDLGSLISALKDRRARYVQFVVPPDVIDVNFCFELLERATTLDDDPFVDFAYGFITGRDPDAARAFLARSLALLKSRKGVPRKILDNLGPNTQMKGRGLMPWMGPPWPAFARQHYQAFIFSHGNEGFHDANLEVHQGYGLIHFGGHGMPDRISDGVTATQLEKLRLDGAVVFNGACSTGVTSRYFDMIGPEVKVKTYAPEELFCLRLLDTGIAAYFAAVHPDHGIPVYQEMEYLLSTGASCGDTMKSTYDSVVMGEGGKRPSCPRLEAGKPFARRTPKDVMLYGTAARVLFGDPLARPVRKTAPPPFEIRTRKNGDGFSSTIRLINPLLKYTLQDTFHSHLSANGMQFNDRIYVQIPLPRGVEAVEGVTVVNARVHKRQLPHELMAHAVEELDGRRLLHVQIDFPTAGYQQSAMRSTRTVVEIVFRAAAAGAPSGDR